MLKSFSAANFRSIKAPVLLELSRSNRKKSKVLNYASQGALELSLCTVIYGANASGKSNLLRALQALKILVTTSAKFSPNEQIWVYQPFRLEAGYESKPTLFTAEFFLKSVKYVYSVHFSARKIEKEKLVYYPSGREALLFDRTAGREILFGDTFRGEKKTIEKLTLANQLFLSKAAENNSESCIPVYNFFDEVITEYPFLNYSESAKFEQLLAELIANNPGSPFTRKLNALVCSLDTGIRSVTAAQAGALESLMLAEPTADYFRKSPSDIAYKIRTIHDVYNGDSSKTHEVSFDIAEESAGTRSLISMAGLILAALESGKCLIIDEFEKNLHPVITAYLIRLFLNPLTNPQNAQLLFATHDVTQLHDETFNRDQVWFTQKSEQGETELFRCSDIKGLRLNAPLDKWYISGRLGGTAIINDTDFIMAMQEGNGK